MKLCFIHHVCVCGGGGRVKGALFHECSLTHSNKFQPHFLSAGTHLRNLIKFDVKVPSGGGGRIGVGGLHCTIALQVPDASVWCQ